MADNSTTKLLIQTNINKIIQKTAMCDPTIVEDIAFVSSSLAVANYTESLSQPELREFAGKFRDYLELFPKRCLCKEMK